MVRWQNVTIAEIAFGIQKIRPDERADRLEYGLLEWRRRFAGRIFALTEDAALAYGEIMRRAKRQGRGMSAPDGMIAAIAQAQVNGGRLATRNISDFATTASHSSRPGNSDAGALTAVSLSAGQQVLAVLQRLGIFSCWKEASHAVA